MVSNMATGTFCNFQTGQTTVNGFPAPNPFGGVSTTQTTPNPFGGAATTSSLFGSK